MAPFPKACLHHTSFIQRTRKRFFISYILYCLLSKLVFHVVTFFFKKGEREKCWFVPLIYAFTGWVWYVPSLGITKTHNPGVSGWCPHQLIYLARAPLCFSRLEWLVLEHCPACFWRGVQLPSSRVLPSQRRSPGGGWQESVLWWGYFCALYNSSLQSRWQFQVLISLASISSSIKGRWQWGNTQAETSFLIWILISAHLCQWLVQ